MGSLFTPFQIPKKIHTNALSRTYTINKKSIRP